MEYARKRKEGEKARERKVVGRVGEKTRKVEEGEKKRRGSREEEEEREKREALHMDFSHLILATNLENRHNNDYCCSFFFPPTGN